MNPDPPSREQIEARLTALLLGELPAAEAELLRWSISQDPELQKLHDQLKLTIGFVSEAMKHPVAEEPAAKAAPLKLSPDRREKLLAHFKTPGSAGVPAGDSETEPGGASVPASRLSRTTSPKPANESFWLKTIEFPRLRPLAMAALVIGISLLLAAMLLPALSSAKRKAQSLSMLSAMQEESLQERNQPKEVSPDTTPVPPPPPVAAPPQAETALPHTQPPSREVALGPTVYSAQVVGYVNSTVPTNPTTSSSAAWYSFPNENRAAGNSFASGNDGSGGFNDEKKEKHGFALLGPMPPTSSGNQTADLENSDTTLSLAGQAMPAPAGGAYVFADHQKREARVEPGPFNPNRTFPAAPPPASPPADGVQGEAMDVTVFHLTNAEPQEVAQVLQKMFGSDTGSRGGIGSSQQSALQTRAQANAPDQFQTSANALALNGNFDTGTTREDLSGLRLPHIITTTAAATASSDAFAGPVGPSTSLPAATGPESAGSAGYTGSPYNNGDGYSGGLKTLYQNEDRQIEATKNELDKLRPGADYSEKKRELEQMLWLHTNLAANIENRETNLAALNAQFQQNEAQITAAQNEVDNLRQQLNIEDKDPNSMAPTPTLTLELLQRYADQQVEGEKEYQLVQTQLDELKGYSPNRLREVLPTVVPDATLTDLLDQLHDAQQKYALVTNNSASDNGTKTSLGSEIETLNHQIDDRVNGVMASLESAVRSQKAALDEFANAVENAKTNESAVALRAQPYWEKKRELERMLDFHKVLAAKIEVEEATLGLTNTTGGSAPSTAAPLPQTDLPLVKQNAPPPIPQPEVLTRENAFSTFSMNVSDVSFKLAAASLEKGLMPAPASIRSEEFINAFDYRDPAPLEGQPLAFASERARYPFAHERDLLRFSIQTAAAGREAGRALNLVILLDISGSMERADRVAIIHEALQVLAAQLQPQDTVSVVTFARTARLWADGVPGDQAGATLEKVGAITPEGGTNLEEAMRLAYETALRHYLAHGLNRVVLLTDGAANLGNVDPAALTQKVEANRKQGIDLDCFGIGWEDYNDDLLEQLSSNGDGRYAFLNSPDEATNEFAAKLAGALQVAAQDVKVQVEFNPQRVIAWRQIGYARHQLTKEQFRDNTVAAAQIAAAESGNALYTIQTNPNGAGPIATVRVRYRVPGTDEYREHSWDVPYDGNAPALEQSSPAMRLAATAAAFSEWLASSPFAQDVTPDELLNDLSGVPQIYGADQRPAELEWMIRQAKSISGK